MEAALGDFNGDGRRDLAVAIRPWGDTFATTNRGVSILLGTSNGTFAAPLSYSTGPNSVAVAVGDFNEDGRADLVVVNSGFYDSSQGELYGGSVSVLLGNGDGTFRSAVQFRPVPCHGLQQSLTSIETVMSTWWWPTAVIQITLVAFLSFWAKEMVRFCQQRVSSSARV
jgi:hypothetical protein